MRIGSIINRPSLKGGKGEIPSIHSQKSKPAKRFCKWEPVCPMKRFYEQGRLDKKWIEQYCQGDWEHCKRYDLEERGIYHPDNMLPDGSIDESLV